MIARISFCWKSILILQIPWRQTVNESSLTCCNVPVIAAECCIRHCHCDYSPTNSLCTRKHTFSWTEGRYLWQIRRYEDAPCGHGMTSHHCSPTNTRQSFKNCRKYHLVDEIKQPNSFLPWSFLPPSKLTEICFCPQANPQAAYLEHKAQTCDPVWKRLCYFECKQNPSPMGNLR